MSNETDLDWLARNVHHWASDHAKTISYSTEFGSERYGDGLPYPKYTKHQWLARRAELQNKPSWDSAPSNAEWRAQHSTGYGCWGRGTATQAANGIWYSPEFGTAQWTGFAGEVLGDWRDTLERRPEHTRAEMEVELVKAALKPFTSIEDNQELNMSQQQEMKQDNGWFERGELPPVGVECEMKHKYSTPDWARPGFEPVVIVASGKDLFISSGTDLYRETVGSWDEYEFRPIRTEREVAIEVMLKDSGALECDTVMSILENLIDKGWAKESK